MRWLTRVIIAFAALGLVLAIGRVVQSAAEFEVIAAAHSNRGKPDWRMPESEAVGFTPIRLPYFFQDGCFRVEFESNAVHLDLDLFVEDCVTEATIDGKPLIEPGLGCQRCEIFHKKPGDRCRLTPLSFDLEGPGPHLLAVRTKNKSDKDEPTRRDTKLFWVQHDANAFGARVVALVCALLLLGVAWSRWRNGSAVDGIVATVAFIQNRHKFLILATFAVIIRVVVVPAALTTDVSQSAMIYAEDLVQRDDLHVTKLDPVYATAAKYNGESHMHKPPGVYYQYALPRILFGFSDIYYRYLTRIPAIVGDLLIAWILFGTLATRKGEDVGLLGAACFLFSAGVFATDGMLGRPDSLAIAFLLFALRNISNRWFSLFLGLAVAWKHLALLVVPWFITRRETAPRVLWAGAITLVLCAPYLLDDPQLFLHRLTFPQIEKGISGLVWIKNLTYFGFGQGAIEDVGRALAFGFVLALCVLPWFVRPNPWTATAITFSLFLVCAKNVTEHYILWPMPALLIAYAETRRLTLLVAVLMGSLSMAFHHERALEIDGDVAMLWSALLALSYAAAAAVMIRDSRRRVAGADANPSSGDPASGV